MSFFIIYGGIYKDKNHTLFHYVPGQFALTTFLHISELDFGNQQFDENHQKFMK